MQQSDIWVVQHPDRIVAEISAAEIILADMILYVVVISYIPLCEAFGVRECESILTCFLILTCFFVNGDLHPGNTLLCWSFGENLMFRLSPL